MIPTLNAKVKAEHSFRSVSKHYIYLKHKRQRTMDQATRTSSS